MATSLPLEVDEELRQVGPVVRPNGRPRAVLPMKTLLRQIPTTKSRVDAGGMAALDFSMTAEVLALLGAINLEAALSDEEVPVSARIDWTLRMAPFLNQLREGFRRKKGANLPKTTEALAEEASKRSENIKKLMAALGKPSAEAGEVAAEVILPQGDDDDESDTLDPPAA